MKNRVGTLCSRRGCGHTAAWQHSKDERTLLCPDHAADICAITVLIPYDGVTQLASDIEHGTLSGYRKESRRGLVTCEECRQAWKRYKIDHARASEVAA